MYQLDSTSRGGLVALLAVEQKTLSSMGGPGDDVVRNLSSLLALQIRNKLVLGDGFGTEPEVVLGVDQVPNLG